MKQYKKMYFTLFNAMTDTIKVLQHAQQKAEEIYIESEDCEPDASPESDAAK